MKWLIAAVLCCGIAGCNEGVNVQTLEYQTSTAINTDAIAKHSGLAANSVTLALEEGNKYTGYVDMSDGSRHPLTVIYDGSKLIYNFTG